MLNEAKSASGGKQCDKFKADITDFARGEHKYIKDFDAMFNHLKECEECRVKYFELEEIFGGLKEAYYKPSPEFTKRMEEIKAMARKGPPPLTEEQRVKKGEPLAIGIELYKKQKWFEAAKQFDEAVKQLEKGKQIPPSPFDKGGERGILADAYYHRGLAHQKMNSLDEALADFNKAIELDPDDADAYYHRAEVRIELEPTTIDQTLMDLSQAIRLNPDHSDAYYGRALIYLYAGENQRAVDEFSQVIELEPEENLAYFYRGNAYIKMKSIKLARKDFNKVIELFPKEVAAYHNLGITYAMESKFKEAIAEFKRALEVNPEYQIARETLQMAQERIKVDELRTKILAKIREKEKARLTARQAKKKKGRQRSLSSLTKHEERIKQLETENKMLKEFNEKLLNTITRQQAEYTYQRPTQEITGFPVLPEATVISPKNIRIRREK